MALAGFVLLLLVAGGVFMLMPLQKMPPLRQIETVMKIDWNENIHLDENSQRVSFLIRTTVS
jgi:hypothetical protein